METTHINLNSTRDEGEIKEKLKEYAGRIGKSNEGLKKRSAKGLIVRINCQIVRK